MGLLILPLCPEIPDPKKCSFIGNFEPCAADWTGYRLCASHIRVSALVERKNQSISRTRFLCNAAGLSMSNSSDNDGLENVMVTEFFEEPQLDGANKEVSSANLLSKKEQVNHVGKKSRRKIWTRLRPESSMASCNFVLRMLEKSSNKKALDFFEWMRKNGKLKQNHGAYNLVMRVLARKEDWAGAEMLLLEMTRDSDCQLTSRQFNSLINVCVKRGLVEQGEKWFHMMLESGVQPDVVTFTMLMGLYQRGGSVSQAEFAFGCMRDCKLHFVAAYSAMITIYARLGMYSKSEEIISLMEEDNVLPNLENWLVRVNIYCQQGKIKEAGSSLKSMLELGLSPDIVAYNMLITACGRVSDTKAAQRLFQNLQSIGLEPDETTYRTMVEGFGRTDNYSEAMLYYKKLKDSGFQPSSSNFYTMINLQSRHGDDKGIIQTLKDMEVMGCQLPSMLSTLLHAYERIGRIDVVPLVLKSSFYEKLLLNQTSCSILVMFYVKHSLLDNALQVLLEKRWNDPDFEDNLYHLLICSCKEASRYEDAARIYNQMPKSGVKPNLHITCTMIDIYSAMDRYIDAEKLYLELKASGITFDMVAFSIVVRMYAKSSSFKDACLVLDTMEKQKDIVPDKFLFFDMLRIYQQCGMHEKLADVYYRILKSGVELDEAMYNCIINCCGRALPVDELSRLFDEMVERGFTANTLTFNVLLDVYGKAGLLRKARKVFWMARKQGLADIISYNTIIASCGRNKDFSGMRYFVQRMEDAGYPASLEAYNCMLDAYGKEDLLEEFNDVLEKMKRANCACDLYTYNIMIDMYGKKRMIQEIADVLAELKERKMGPDLYSYNSLIKAYGIARMVEEAVNVLQEMRGNGIVPDRVTYTNLIKAFQRNENFLEAVKWSLWMKQTGMRS